MVQYVTSGKYSLCISTWYNLKQQKCLCHTDIGNLLCCPSRILQCAYLNPFLLCMCASVSMCATTICIRGVSGPPRPPARHGLVKLVGRGMLLSFSCWLFRSKIIWQLTIDGSFYKGRRHALVKLVCWGRGGGKGCSLSISEAKHWENLGKIPNGGFLHAMNLLGKRMVYTSWPSFENKDMIFFHFLSSIFARF